MSSGLDAAQIRRDALELLGVDMPISGGGGNSRNSPIVIEDADPSRSAYWEHQVIGFIYSMRGVDYKFEKATMEEHEGRIIEQYKLSRPDDEENYYNYYFDVTAAMGSKDI